jgi:hypothetical protein
MAVQGQNQQLASLPDRFTYMRTGRVVTVNPFFALVDVGGTQLPAAYVRQSEPEIGDVVAILRQFATWMIVGTSSASGENLVQNPSFEEAGTDSKPTGWTQYNITNTSSWEAVSADDAIDQDGGDRVLEVWGPTALTGTSYVYSAPIGVEPGQTAQLSAYVNGFYPADNPNTTDVSLRALWFANATNLYPTTSEPDSTIASITNIAENEVMTLLSGSVTVPPLAVFMRVGLRTVVSPNAGAHWDFVTARLIG